MQNFGTLRQLTLGDLADDGRREREREEEEEEEEEKIMPSLMATLNGSLEINDSSFFIIKDDL
jgi:hypothetical protein